MLLSLYCILRCLAMTAVLTLEGAEVLFYDVSHIEGYLIKTAFESLHSLHWKDQSKLTKTQKLPLLATLKLPDLLYFSSGTKHD